MPFANSLIESAEMLAAGGALILIGTVVLGAVLAAYAVYWLFFKAGKE